MYIIIIDLSCLNGQFIGELGPYRRLLCVGVISSFIHFVYTIHDTKFAIA